jgi:LacI family transcriptional regulator
MSDKSTNMLSADQVVVDDYQGAYQAVVHLLEQGYRRIAHINGNETLHHSAARKSGYLDALQAYGIPFEQELLYLAEEFTIEEGAILAEEMFSPSKRADAVFSISDEILIGVHQYCKAKQLRIPEDVGMVGFSDSTYASIIDPSLSSVYQPGHEMGKLAVQRLLTLIRAEEDDMVLVPENYVLKTKLVIRKSSMRRS